MRSKNYLVKEAAAELRTGENTIRNLIADGRLRVVKMPTSIIPDIEIERFRREMLESQEDLTRYSAKNFKATKEEKSNIVKIGGTK